MFRRRVDDERRQDLLQHIAVLLQQQAEELAGVMRDQIDLQPVMDAGFLDGLVPRLQPDHFLERQQMHAPQVDNRNPATGSRTGAPADRGEEQRIRMLVRPA